MVQQQDDPIPAIDLSNASSPSEGSLPSSDDEDPLEHPLSAQRSSRFTPFRSPKYQLPPHISPRITLDSVERAGCTPILEQPTLLATALLPLAPCSSCGTDPSISCSSYIVLSCDHLLCPACLSTLVNSVSNDPPREPDCFACGREATNFRGVRFVEAAREEEFRTPKKSGRILRFGTPETIPGLSPFRKLDWSESFSTPGTTPESSGRKSSSFACVPLLLACPNSVLTRFFLRSSPSKNEILQPQAWHVGRVDNVRSDSLILDVSQPDLAPQIPWDLTIADVICWIPPSVSQIPSDTQPLSVHILCNRSVPRFERCFLVADVRCSHDCRTLNNLYIELPSLAAAQTLVRLKNGKTIQGRPISVVLSSQAELLENVRLLRSRCVPRSSDDPFCRSSRHGRRVSTASTLLILRAKDPSSRPRTSRDSLSSVVSR